MSRRNNRESGMTSEDAQSVQRFEVPFIKLTPHQLRDLKETLLNLVCTALIQQPRMSVTDPTIIKITKLAKKIAYYDPEFVLKLAMYVRLDLNIRSTANYLLAVASNIKECQPYVRKYFGATVRLPSDWLDVAATYLILPDKNLKGKALPTCLRKSMDGKFADFDAYQLGKYNKERTIKRKLKKIKEEQAKGNAKAVKPDKPMITLKQMIRQLHISSPNYQVMCLLGKKYPVTETEFRLSGLPGNYDPDKAGTRMKLPTPETWETLLSEKGNKASTWEELIEHKKLPFMAMLRNLRNLIYTGVHPRYHRWVQNKLSNKQTVAQSKQFPTAFFSAYEVIPRDIEHFKQLLAGQNDDKKPPKKDANGKEQVRRKRKKPIVPAHMPTNQIFDDYRRALDQSVKHATTCNINPIRGSTVVFCNVSSETREASPGARGMGTSVRSIQEVGYLLGLMCKYVCEDCDFRVWSSPTREVLTSHLPVQLIEGSILDNMSVVAEVAAKLGDKPGDFPFDYLEEMIRDKRKVDNFLVLSHHVINPSGGGGSNSRLANLLNKYRQEVNSDLLFVSVDLSGSGKSAIGQDEKHPNDIQITGFSDQILRFIAERGDTNQLQYVEHIDEAKRLNKGKTQAAWDTAPWWKWLDTLQEEAVHYPNITTGPSWREARVFISSTFLDMHGERDVLTRVVLPEVKERAKQRKVRIYEVDLRWGVTEEEAQSGKSIQLCLDEVDRCRPFFIGILGERYGWAPAEYEVPDHPRFAWLKDYPKGRSITELEMHYAALSNPGAATGAFFYLRDHTSFSKDVPEAQRKFFDPSGPEDRQKMSDLKQRIRSSGIPLLDYYPCKYGGTENGDGVVAVNDLTLFSEQVFHDLWGAIEDRFPPDLPPADSIELERTYHQAFVQQQLENFVGRKEVLSQMKKFAEGYHTQLMVISGAAGDGKSSLMANFAADYATKNSNTFVLPHFVGSSPDSTDVRSMLHRMCVELKQVFSLEEEIPEDFKDLCTAFASMLESASFKGKLILVIDAINQLDEKIERSHFLEWLPSKLPCKVIISCLADSKTLSSLKHPRFRGTIVEVPMPPLDIKERTELVRATLWKYHKKLDEKPMNTQMRVLLRKADAGNPLYLTVACEELRVFGVYERVSDRIKRMADKLPRLFEEVLRRMETDHGQQLVPDACSLIVSSRGGLVEKELVDLLGLDQHDLKWTGFLRSLTPFLKPSGDRGEISFFHDAFKLAVQKRYITNARAKVKYDSMLADYFYHVLDPLKTGEWSGCNEVRAVSELPHHLVEAEKWSDLQAVLCDLSFLELKVMHGMTNGLISDFNEATKNGLKYPGLPEIKEFREFVKSCAHVIAKNPTLTFQQAANQPSASSPAKKATQLWVERLANQSWIEWTNKPEENDPCKMTFSGFTEGVTATAFSSRDNLVACATRDCTIHIYDSESGSELCTLAGHSSWIPSVKFSPDGSLLASAGWDSIIILWDVREGKELTRFTSHQRRVNDIAFSSDSSMLASASWDTDVKVFLTNGETREKYSIPCGERPLNSVAWGPEDKKLIVGTWDGTIKVISMDYEEEGKILATMEGHKKSVQAVAYSPSGKHLVSGSLDQELLLWDAQAGKLISSLSKHSKPVTSVAYTTDGSHLLSASADATVKVWDANLGTEKDQWECYSGWMNCCSYHPLDDTLLATGSSECYAIIWYTINHLIKHRLDHHARPITCIEFSPDGRYLATGSEDGTLAIWDPEVGVIHTVLEGHTASVTGMSWSPDSTRLATSSDDFSIIIWEADSGKKARVLKGHDSAVRSICFDPKGKMLVSASRDNTLRLWDSRSGNLSSVMRGHTDWITSCAFNPAGNRIVSCAWDNTVRLWNPRRTDPIATMEGHDSSVAFVRFSKDGKNIISCSFDTTIKIWDSESATEITTLSGHKERVNGFSQNTEGHIASVSDDTTIRIWDPLAATEVRTLIGHSQAIRSAAFHPQTKTIITASDDKTMKYWDIDICKVNDGGWAGSSGWGGSTQAEEVLERKPLAGHSSAVNHLSLSKSGEYFLTVGDDKKCFLWDTETSHVTRTFRLPEQPTFKCCAFLPNEQSFVTASDDGDVWLWDIRTAKKLRRVATHAGPATSCSISKDGGTVVSGGWDNNVTISDLRATISRQITGHTDWVLTTAQAPNGDLCASAGWDETVRVWSTAAFSRKHVLTGHMDTVTSLAISPDSRYLASASYDSVVKVWNLTGGIVEATLPGHVGHVNKVAFAPSAPTVLFSAGEDGVVKLWDVAKKSLKNEFMCKGPATACDVVVKGNELFMVFGDAIGNIYTANLHGAR